MTARRGVVYDLGYVRYDGPRLGRRGAVTATVRDGMFRILGFHRKARYKILPFFLLALAVLPAVAFVGFSFLLSNFAPDAESPFGGHAEYFSLIGTTVLLFVALAAPELLIPDRRHGVLSVYSSRPLLPDDYVWARFGALLAVLSLFLLVPQFLMYIGFSALTGETLMAELIARAGELPKIVLTAAVYALAYAPPALLIAAYTKRKAVASGVYLAVMLVGMGLVAGVVQATVLPGHRFAALAALIEHPNYVRDWIYGRSATQELIVSQAGFAPWVSAVMIAAVAGISLLLVVRRYRRSM